MSLVILVPMLGRPQTVAPLLESIRATCDARVKWLLTEGDEDVIAEVWRHVERDTADGLASPADVEEFPRRERGDYAYKINHGIALSLQEHIFTGACDLRFHPGWYEVAVTKLTPGIGVVGTNDLTNERTSGGRNDHATHMLVTREYANLGTIDGQPGFFSEAYWHEWCDDEAVATAKKRGAYAHAADSHVEHMHPMRGKGESDAMYEAAPRRIADGRRIWSERRRRWFLR